MNGTNNLWKERMHQRRERWQWQWYSTHDNAEENGLLSAHFPNCAPNITGIRQGLGLGLTSLWELGTPLQYSINISVLKNKNKNTGTKIVFQSADYKEIAKFQPSGFEDVNSGHSNGSPRKVFIHFPLFVQKTNLGIPTGLVFMTVLETQAKLWMERRIPDFS